MATLVKSSNRKQIRSGLLKALSSVIVFLFGFSTTLMAQYGVVETEYAFKGTVISEATGERIPGIKLSIRNKNDRNYYDNRLESAPDGSFQIFTFMHTDLSEMEIYAEDIDGEQNGGTFKPASVNVLTDDGVFTRDPVRQGSWHHYYDYSDTIKIIMQQEAAVTPTEPDPSPAADSITIASSQPDITVEADTSEQGTAGINLQPVIVNQPVLIYPNPAKDIITIELMPAVAQEIRIALFDADNRLIKNIVVAATEGTVSRQIDLGSYSSGIYYLRIEGTSFRASGKVVKN